MPEQLRDTFRSLDPAAALPPQGEPAREELLVNITARTRTSSGRRSLAARVVPDVVRRRPVFWLAGVVASATVVAVLGTGLADSPTQTQAYADTPAPLSVQQSSGLAASKVLERIASRAEQVEEAEPPKNAAEYFHTDGLSRCVNCAKDGGATFYPEEVKLTREPGGMLRQVIKRNGGVERDRYREEVRREPAPTDPYEMRKWVLQDGDTAGPMEFLERLGGEAGREMFGPDQRAAMLRAMKGSMFDKLEYVGTVEDRVGRKGAAFSLEDGQTKYTIVFDQRNGKLLAIEETLLKDPGELNVKTPAVIGYTTFLAAEYREK